MTEVLRKVYKHGRIMAEYFPNYSQVPIAKFEQSRTKDWYQRHPKQLTQAFKHWINNQDQRIQHKDAPINDIVDQLFTVSIHQLGVNLTFNCRIHNQDQNIQYKDASINSMVDQLFYNIQSPIGCNYTVDL